MECDNIKCPHYKKSDKRTSWERALGVTNKKGGCKHSFCKKNRR